MPSLVPISPEAPGGRENRAAWKVLAQWTKPCLTAFGDSDPVTNGGERVFHKLVPGNGGGKHNRSLEGGGHFLQEDVGPALGAAIAEFIAATPTSTPLRAKL